MRDAKATIFLTALLVCQCPLSTAWADILGVDQRNDGFTPVLFQSVSNFSPIGQEFTPTFSKLNFVDLFTEGFFPPTTGLFVNIRAGTISGPILGTSQTVPTASLFGETDFLFPAEVPLIPGDLYVIEVVTVDGLNWGLGSSGVPTYSKGNEILNGEPNPQNDLWFREGDVPEPSGFSLLLIVCGVLALKHYAPQFCSHRR